MLAPVAARAGDPRIDARSRGGDLPTARRIAAAVLAIPAAAQVLQVRCERFGAHADCGIVLSGKKFHRRVDAAGWNADVASLLAAAFAAAPAVDEIDLWATVPAGTGYGTVVSGDFAKPSSANVFSITVPRTARGEVPARLHDGRGVFWDPAFRASVAKGSDG